MTKQNKDRGPVGYKQPPQRTRFRSGQSGNPKGRPPKLPSFADDVVAELSAVQTMGADGMPITRQRAIVLALIKSALKGDTRAVSTLVRHLPAEQPDQPQPELTATDKQLLRDMVAEEIAGDA